MIWFANYSLTDILPLTKNNMVEHLGIEITEIGSDFLKGKMPVDHRTVQPMNILHGGASVALAETLGSIAAVLTVDASKYSCVGMEINANHIRPVSSGYVYATARPVHLGKKSQVWSIEIVNEEGKMVCISRITMAVIDKPF
ncbi:MAG: hotdog fold thioesterase [Bacteroidia bacterium]|nr:hotdog fold thioesterase [Bacteroidota bacterium]MBP9081565.1 hotdog fold thioesterase [Bacteroidia bacterium]MBK7390724.1 hotdog fold thioesterase [Bacteroidota bacterium]MBK7971487.1 hotdog fold thioesterase [Bacteroidota bacterium]MBK8414711.1 hotdog fold thioesterase [Bacteroidota bacterium]